MGKDNLQKILFAQQVSENVEIESLWCIKEEDNYIVDNIPFIAKKISLGDKIKAEYDEEEKHIILTTLYLCQAIAQSEYILKTKMISNQQELS
jgi:hypothetical protein